MQKGIIWLFALCYLGGFLSPLASFGLANSRIVQITHSHQHSDGHDHHHHPVDGRLAKSKGENKSSSLPQSGDEGHKSTHTHNICVAPCNPLWIEKSFSLLLTPKLKRIIDAFPSAVFTSVNLGAIFRPPIA